ncbi:MAG: hypothetical protein IJF92_06215 [Bacilli bacterium]|nr:hypothetical protein [Bacilli bacterium]
MNFIKKNKFTVLAVVVFLILILLLVQIKNIFFPNEEKAIYGNRLEGSSSVKISDSKKKFIENNITSDGIANKASVRVSGRIIEVMITVESETSVDVAKELTDKILDTLNKSEEHYYDVQVFINKSEETSNFPIIGYKHHKKKHFAWTKNR